MSDLLPQIKAFLEKHRMEPSAFGRGALKDSHFYFELEKGERKFRRKTLGKVKDFMRNYGKAK